MAGEWRDMPFSEAVTLNPPTQLIRGTEYPFVDMESVNTGSRCVYGNERRVYDGGGSRFRCGDTLMARITPCLENGKIARFCGKPDTVAHGSTEFIVIRGRDGMTQTDYAYYLTRWDGVSGYAISQMTGTSGRQRVPTAALDHVAVPVPPIPEQRAIADILGKLDDKIELNRRMNETLEAIARALFKSWFVNFDPVHAKAEGCDTGLPPHLADLFPDSLGDSELGLIPRGWRVGKVSEICSSITSGGTPSTQVPSYWDGELRWLSSGETRERFITATEKTITEEGVANSSTRLAKANSTVVASAGQGHTRGQTSLLLVDSYINQSVVVLCADDKAKSDLYLFFDLSARYEEMRRISDSSSSRGSLTTKLLGGLPMVFPTTQLVNAFDRVASPAVQRIRNNAVESRTLAALRDTLLPKLISGEIRVKDGEKYAEAAT